MTATVKLISQYFDRQTEFGICSEVRTFHSNSIRQSGDVPVPADFDGDGKTDFAVFRPSNGTWYVLESISGFKAFQWGTNGDKALVGDFDGDERDDATVFRPSTELGISCEARRTQPLYITFGVAGR